MSSTHTTCDGTVRDRLWAWGNEAGVWSDTWGLPAVGRMSGAEGAMYLGLPNGLMVSHDGEPAPPLEQYAIAYRPLKRVMWSIVHSGGATDAGYTDHVLDIAARFPNFTGVFLDDFFVRTEGVDFTSSLSLDQLSTLRDRLSLPERTLELWAVHYTHQFDLPVGDYVALCDTLTFWTWNSNELRDLEANLDRMESLYPDLRRAQGVYVWDYHNRHEVQPDLMRHQCETGLQWLRDGRIEAMIFIGSGLLDIGLHSAEWLRQWIAEVGDELL